MTTIPGSFEERTGNEREARMANINYVMIVAMDSSNGIGKGGTLPWNIPADLKRFSTITKGTTPFANMVVMGRKTWESLPTKSRPLPHRVNVVLTRNPEKIDTSEIPPNMKEFAFFVDDMQQIHAIAQHMQVKTVFIIGGSTVYETFASKVTHAYVTKVHGDYRCDTFFPSVIRPREIYGVGHHPTHCYELWKMPSFAFDNGNNNTSLRATMTIVNKHDAEYCKLLRYVLEHGIERSDRTGTGTLSIFAPHPPRFDISESVPLLTTKKMGPKGIIKELLWFLRGDTDAKILQRQGVHIWDENTSREFLDKRGLPYEEGVTGPGYGWSFRRFGGDYDERYADSANITPEISSKLGGFDQLMYVENLLKNDPESRRIYMNLWNAKDLSKMALPPCHVGIQFYVSNKVDLSCHVYIRSNDLFLGIRTTFSHILS